MLGFPLIYFKGMRLLYWFGECRSQGSRLSSYRVGKYRDPGLDLESVLGGSGDLVTGYFRDL